MAFVGRAGLGQFDIGFDKQKRKNDVADTAGQPDSNKQSRKYTDCCCNSNLALDIH